MAMQTVHLFEGHDHFVCTSDVEQHFHEHENVDCSLFHYQFEMYSSDLKNTFTHLFTHIYSDQYNTAPQLIGAILFSKQYSRGPPLV